MPRTGLLAVVSFMTLLATIGVTGGQEKPTTHTRKLQEGASSPPARIEDFAWISGHWTGEAFGGRCDEIWSPPQAGCMIGLYRLVKDDQPVFFEILSLSEVGDTVVLRLKHFHPDLKGWEEKDETIDFRLVAVTENELFFEGMTFRRTSPDQLDVYLAVRPKDGPVREHAFTYKRVAPRKD
jgi:hypothetical protein